MSPCARVGAVSARAHLGALLLLAACGGGTTGSNRGQAEEQGTDREGGTARGRKEECEDCRVVEGDE